MNLPLITIGPFGGVDYTTDAFYLDEGLSPLATNADPVTTTRALQTVLGRSVFVAAGLPAGYTFQCLVRFQSFSGGAANFQTSYFFSAIKGGSTMQGVYTLGGAVVFLNDLRPFTQAVQFEDGLWTNGGQQVRLRNYGEDSGWLVDEWQLQPPAQVLGAIGTESGSDSPGVGTYSYALAWIRSSSDADPTIVQQSSPFYLNGSVSVVSANNASLGTFAIAGTPQNHDTIKLSVNSFSVLVTASGADTPTTLAASGAIALNANSSIAALVSSGSQGADIIIQAVIPGTSGNAITYHGLVTPSTSGHATISPISSTHLTGGTPGVAPTITLPTADVEYTDYAGLTIDAALFRFSVLQPLYLEVGLVKNLATTTSGIYTIVKDDTPDSVIASNTPLVNNQSGSDHHDPPPFVTTVSAVNATGATTWQTTWEITNPGFVEIHKGRLWAFTLYPNVYNLKNTTTGQPGFTSLTEVQLQSQLWFSDYETPWSFNDVDDVVTVGDEETPGNSDWGPTLVPGTLHNPGWNYNTIDDVPRGLASTGSYLCALKSLSFWVVYGDDPNSFRVYEAFDIGCASSTSIAKGEGGVFWAAPEGVHFYTGGTPLYISEPIRLYVDSNGGWFGSVAFYYKRTYYITLSNGACFAYYVPTQKWYPVGFGFEAVAATLDNAWTASNLTMSQWAASPQDNGEKQQATWTSKISDCSELDSPQKMFRGQTKQARYLIVDAAPQDANCVVTVTANPQTTLATTWTTGTFNLSHPPGAGVLSIPGAFPYWYTAQVEVLIETPADATSPTVLRRVTLMGDVAHALKDNRTQWDPPYVGE
jgi:hypothetical protein